MKKIILQSLIVFFSFLFIIRVDVFADNNLQISAKTYVLIEKDTKKILHSKDEHTKMPMASTTKIMTTILALESKDLDTPFKVEEKWVKVEGSSMGLLPGDTVTMLDLCYGMMLASGNDAANVVAYKLAGDIKNFAKLMNDKAKEIGMKNTNFVTPSGLDDKDHYSTAYDMALLARYALNNQLFKEICSTQKKQLSYGNPPYDRWLSNHNKLLKTYEGCIGVKTGFTKKSGRCLVSAVQKDNTTLIAVTLNAPNDWQDHTRLYNYGFKNIKVSEYKINEDEISLNVVGANEKNLLAKPKTQVYNTILDENEKNNIKTKIYCDKFLYAPIKKDDVVGKISIIYNDTILSEIDLIATKDIEYKSKLDIIIEDKNWLQKLVDKIKTLV